MADRRLFWKWHGWKSSGFCPKLQIKCTLNLKWKCPSKLELRSGNHAIYIAPKTENSIWPPGHIDIQIHIHIYTSIELLKFGINIQSKIEVRVRNQNKIKYGRHGVILRVTSLKIKRLLAMDTINMHMKFQNKITLRKPCRPRTDGRAD